MITNVHNRKQVKIRLFRFLKIVIPAAAAFIACAGVGLAQSQAIPDEENCLICHRYPSMGRYDDKGEKRVYYVNDQMFANSVHGKLNCKGCHEDLEKIPHEDVKEVNCSTRCHIKEPPTEKDFSHKDMAEKYQQSVHGEGEEGERKFPEDRPTCTYCHDNRSYNPYAGYWGGSEALARETLARCQGCHTDKSWTRKFYAHFTHRMRRRRDQSEVVRLCTSCHENEKKMARHGLEPVSTFKETFHWSLIKYDVENAPDCITCHVPVGYSTHKIQPRTDPISPVNEKNRVKTCSNQGGIQSCHAGATERFAKGRVHAYGTKAQLIARQESEEDEPTTEDSLILERARKELSDEEIFQYKVLSIIKLAYKILIAGVIGFMTLHQLLDYRRTRKKIKKEGAHSLKADMHDTQEKGNGNG